MTRKTEAVWIDSPLARSLVAVLTVAMVAVAGFALLQSLAGDPIDRLDDPSIPAAQAARTRRALALDEPPATRFLRTAASYLRGDLGYSYSQRSHVGAALARSIPYSLRLGVPALLLSYGLGLLIAWRVARWSRTVRERALGLLVMAGTVPGYWLGLLGLLVFNSWLGLLPSSHAFPPGGGGIAGGLRHLILPLVSLSLPAAALVARYQLAAAHDELEGAGARAARGLGLSEARVAWNHGLRPQLGTSLTLLGLDLPLLVSGAIVVEVVFSWPGTGRLAAQAMLASDYPLALALLLLVSLSVVIGEWIADTGSRRLDPRLRGGSPGERSP